MSKDRSGRFVSERCAGAVAPPVCDPRLHAIELSPTIPIEHRDGAPQLQASSGRLLLIVPPLSEGECEGRVFVADPASGQVAPVARS